MPKVVVKKEKLSKHTQSIEILKMVAASEQFDDIASSLGYSSEEIAAAKKLASKFEVEPK